MAFESCQVSTATSEDYLRENSFSSAGGSGRARALLPADDHQHAGGAAGRKAALGALHRHELPAPLRHPQQIPVHPRRLAIESMSTH